jgi:hypothetical protein
MACQHLSFWDTFHTMLFGNNRHDPALSAFYRRRFYSKLTTILNVTISSTYSVSLIRIGFRNPEYIQSLR